ncbi:MAG: hypothetical protein KBA61_13930 [Spirochaetes bacterium]|jgi:hypothetical protein|nr:hypothetical protein [Spirochaetota bacterium]
MITLFKRLFGKKNHKTKLATHGHFAKRIFLTEFQERKLFLGWMFDNNIQIDSIFDIIKHHDEYIKIYPDSGFKKIYLYDILVINTELMKHESLRHNKIIL